MGSRRKRVRFEDEIIEHIERRRSSRIIALEEKKQQETERKLALALERKNKAKEKVTVDLNEDEKDAYHHQLMSLIKEGQCLDNASTSRSNASMPQKAVLEFILDVLQRKDLDELFAEPVNPDGVENYNQIVEQPMDFGTMRAKLHEGMYTTLQQFKSDVKLICSNAMNTHPATSKHHRVAEVIAGHARKIFDSLVVEPEHFALELSLNKKHTNKKAQNRRLRSPRNAIVSPKLDGENSSTTTIPKIAKREMYWPPNDKSLVAEFLTANKPNIQFNIDPSNYKSSLLRFTKDLGPTAQRVAAKKTRSSKLFGKLRLGH